MKIVNSELCTVNSKRPLLVILFILFTVHCSLSPASAVSKNAGTKNGAFLKIPVNARGVAMGQAMTSLAEGTDALYWNPAGLSKTESKELAATHVQYFQDITMQNVSFAYSLGDAALAVSLFNLSPGNLEGRNALGDSTGDFEFRDTVGAIGFGKQIRSSADGMEVSVGGTVKIVQEKIADTSFNNPAADLGVQFVPIENMRAGATVRNLSSGKANFPREIDAGASYTILKTFTGAVDIQYATDAPIRAGFGGEYRFLEWQSALRAGYRTHDELTDSEDSSIKFLRNADWAGVSMGVGLEYIPPFWKNVKFDLDYAIAPFGALGISHTVTLKTKF